MIAMLFVLALDNGVKADWFHDFNHGLPDSWVVKAPRETGSPRSIDASNGFLAIESALPPAEGGVPTLLGFDESEEFTDVRVSGTINVSPNGYSFMGLSAANSIGRGGYGFGIELAPGSENSGTAWFSRAQAGVGIRNWSSHGDFGIPTRLDSNTSYYLEFDVLGGQLTGRVFDEEGGNELLSMTYSDPRPLGPGPAGVWADDFSLGRGIGGTFDDVSATAIRPGDANLDGEFNSSDLVEVFQRGKYELDIDAGWAEGDWNGDRRFDSGDMVAAFQDGGYEVGALAAVSAVPEPSCGLLLAIAVIGICQLRKRREPCAAGRI
jgi:hypothetical protein